jgi:hypothetical protein
VTSNAAVPIPKKVLLFDVNHRRRGIRAANLRVRGVEVVTAKDLGEAHLFWHERCYDLLLLDGDSTDVMDFSREIQSSCPSQRLAFFVGTAPYLSTLPDAITPVPVADPAVAAIRDMESAYKALPQRNGFVEASLRILMLRTSKRQATAARPDRGEAAVNFLRRIKES